MSLPRPSLRKLLREHLCGATSIRVEPEEREALGRELLDRLGRLGGVETEYSHYVTGPDRQRLVCCFSIKDPDPDAYFHRNEIRFLVAEDDELVVKFDYEELKVRSLDGLEDFVLACRQRLQRRHTLGAKRKKVRELKAHAVVAQVKKIAAELEFDFMIETDSQKLKLFVRLSDEHAVQLGIPFKKFEQMLPQLKTMISTLRELYATGIHFKMVTRAQWGWRAKWISHKDG